MSRKVVFGLLPLVGLMLVAAAPSVRSEGCADDKGPAKGGIGPKKLGLVCYCPYYLIADYGTSKMYYAERCKGTFTSIIMGKDDPYPGNCTDYKNCVSIEEKAKGKDKDKGKGKHKKGPPLDPAEIFQGPKDGYSTKELPARRALVYLETSADGTKKVKVMLYQVIVTPPAKVSKDPLHLGIGVEVTSNRDPNVTINHKAIQGRALNHNMENVYLVTDGTNFTYLVVLDGDTVVEGIKKGK